MYRKNALFCVVTNDGRKVLLKKNWYVFLLFYFFLLFYYFFIFLFYFRREKTGRREPCFARKTKKTLESIHALKMFDIICKYIEQYKTDKIKIKQLYNTLNEKWCEIFEICKNQEFNELFYPFKVVISCFFSNTILSSLEYVSGAGLSVQ